MVTVDSVRAIAAKLLRSYEVVVRGRIKFRVGQIVWRAFSRDEKVMACSSIHARGHVKVPTYGRRKSPPSPWAQTRRVGRNGA